MSDDFSGIPETKREKLDTLSRYLNTQILGQPDAISQIVPHLLAGELGLRANRNAPQASFLFVGPTGVGKTETALEFSRFLFGDNHVIRLDMSEFKSSRQVEHLIGTSSSPGILTREIDRIERGTLLLDEIEKASPQFFDLLLQILDVGQMGVANKCSLDLRKCYIVMTSNIASNALMETKNCSRSTKRRFLEAEAMKVFRPEIFARIDEVVMFEHLAGAVIREVAIKILTDQSQRLAELGYDASLPRSQPDPIRVR